MALEQNVQAAKDIFYDNALKLSRSRQVLKELCAAQATKAGLYQLNVKLRSLKRYEARFTESSDKYWSLLDQQKHADHCSAYDDTVEQDELDKLELDDAYEGYVQKCHAEGNITLPASAVPPKPPPTNVTVMTKKEEEDVKVNVTSDEEDLQKKINESVDKLNKIRQTRDPNLVPFEKLTMGASSTPSKEKGAVGFKPLPDYFSSEESGLYYPPMRTHHMPKFEMPKFDGSASEYPHWIEIFTANILDANITDAEKLTRLISLCTGRAKSAIKDTIIGDKSEGLKAALGILKREFGSNNTLNRAALERLMKKGEIAGDYKSLSDLSLDMSNYQRLMQSQKMQHELDSSATLKLIFQRFTGKMREEYTSELRWRTMQGATAGNEGTGSIVETYSNLLDFVRRCCDVANSTLGSCHFTNHNKNNKNREKVFHSNVVDTSGESKGYVKKCHYCGKNDHFIYKCTSFNALPLPDRFNFIRDRKSCFRCLKPNHTVVKCNSKYACGICHKRSHNTLLCRNAVVSQHIHTVAASASEEAVIESAANTSTTGNDFVSKNNSSTVDSSNSFIFNEGGANGCGEGGSVLSDSRVIFNAGTIAADGQFDKMKFHVVPIVVMDWREINQCPIYAMLDLCNTMIVALL